MDFPADQSIEKAIDRRRSAEKARKDRIFNTRLRVIGLDLDALNQQVQERKHREDTEEHCDRAFDKLRNYHDHLLLHQDINERQKREALHTDLAQYWDTQCADLKCDLKGAVTVTMPEAELGPSSMRIFKGEGIGEEQLKREQMKNTEQDLQAQKKDNERRRMRTEHREMLLSKALLHQDQNRVRQAALEEECRKAILLALDNYNHALAAEQAEKMKEQHRREERENLAEVWHTLTSDMMTECAEAAEIEVGGGRPPLVLTNRWKGMRPEQLHTIRREQEAQRLERQQQRDAEKIQDAAWNLQLLNLSKKERDDEMRAAEMRRERRIRMDQYNMHLAREQQAYQKYMDKELYSNKPTKEYFNQFNTTSR